MKYSNSEGSLCRECCSSEISKDRRWVISEIGDAREDGDCRESLLLVKERVTSNYCLSVEGSEMKEKNALYFLEMSL